MASAIAAARQQINDVGADGDLDAATAPADIDLDLDAVAEPIELPDGKRIYPPRLHGEPIDELACALLDMQRPGRSRFLRLVGPPGTGKSQIARAIAHRLWTRRGRRDRDPPRRAVLRLRRDVAAARPRTSSPSSYEYVPDAEHAGDVRLIDCRVRRGDAHGWVVMIDEVNTIRDVALLSLNATLDGRLSLYLPADGRDRRRPARASRSSSPTTPAWSARPTSPTRGTRASPPPSRSPATGPALAKLGADERLVAAAAALDAKRIAGEDGLVWTPQFRDIEALWHMIERVGERAARVAVRLATCTSRSQAGKVQDAEARRRLPDARRGRLRPAEGRAARAASRTCTATRGR